MIVENQLKTAKTGNGYLAMKIADRSGEMSVKVWNSTEQLYHQLEPGKVIEIHNLQPRFFKEQIQLEWEADNDRIFKIVPENEVDYTAFLPSAPGDLQQYLKIIWDTINGIAEPRLNRLLCYFFNDPDFTAGFTRVPAALKRHHAYIGGLLEHTAGVVSICKAAAAYYPLVNRDLLLTGAILHDIGKTKTYKMGKLFEGTDEGRLIGHLVLGVTMVKEALSTISATDSSDPAEPDYYNGLIHLLVSHHGIMEWGSPIEPLTLEACILHHADNMDAQIVKFLTVIRNQNESGVWADYDPGLGRSVYLGNIPQKSGYQEQSEGV